MSENKTHAQAIIEMVYEALETITPGDKLIVMVHPDDYASIPMIEAIPEQFKEVAQVVFQKSSGVPPGKVVVYIDPAPRASFPQSRPKRKLRIKVKFVWEDIWVGAYVNTSERKLYICLIPCFPIIISHN